MNNQPNSSKSPEQTTSNKPAKKDDLGKVIASTRVDTSINIKRPDVSKRPVKRPSNASGGGPAAKKNKNKSHKEKQPAATPSEPINVSTPSPASTPIAQQKGSGPDVHSSAVDVLQRQEEIEDKLNEEGLGKATLTDLEACRRIGESGASLFMDLKRLVAGEMTERLRGKIFALKHENRYLDGELDRVTRDLYLYRDRNLTAYSADNRGLKDELESLKDVGEKLEAANKKVLEQKKQLERLPELAKELEAVKKRVDEAEAEVQQGKTRIQQLEDEAKDHNDTLAGAAKFGFERAANIAVLLEPTINTDFF